MNKNLIELQKNIKELNKNNQKFLLKEFGKICHENKIGLLISSNLAYNDEGEKEYLYYYKYVRLTSSIYGFDINNNIYSDWNCFVESNEDYSKDSKDENLIANKFMITNNYNIEFSVKDLKKFGAEFIENDEQLVLVTFNKKGTFTTSDELYTKRKYLESCHQKRKK